ncbi:MAG: transglutaminase family protein [Planctomycetota bacterium]
MEYQVTHVTRYESKDPVSVCHNQAWLTPRTEGPQVCTGHEMVVVPEPSTWSQRSDAFGNTVTHFSINGGYTVLEVRARSRVSLQPSSPADPSTSPNWESIAQSLREGQESWELDPFRFDSPRVLRTESLRSFASEHFVADRPILEALTDLTARIFEEFEYDPQATTVTTPTSEVFERKRGVCQDFAHLQIGMLRSLGLAARYVSGYVRTQPPEGQERLIGADASHAWLSIYCGEELGWIDVDPTNNSFPSEEHVTLSWGRDYGDVAPLRGVYTGGSQHRLSVSVDLRPV